MMHMSQPTEALPTHTYYIYMEYVSDLDHAVS